MKTVYSITYNVWINDKIITTVEIGEQTLREALKERRDIEFELKTIYEATHLTLEKVTQIQDNGKFFEQDMNNFPLSSCV